MTKLVYNPAWKPEGEDCEGCPGTESERGIFYICEYQKNRKAALDAMVAPADAPEDGEHNVIFHGVTVEVEGGNPEVRKKLQDALQAELTGKFTERSDMSGNIKDIISKILTDNEYKTDNECKKAEPDLDERLKQDFIGLFTSKNPAAFVQKKMADSLDVFLGSFATMSLAAVSMNMSDEICAALNNASQAIREVEAALRAELVDPVNPPAPFDAPPFMSKKP